MNNKVKFLRGTSDEYAVAEKDGDTIYFTTDDGKLYIGDKEISGDGSITIDDTLSDTSTNPVQNKVVKQAIDNKADKSLYGDTTINVGRKAGTIVGHFSTAEGQATTSSSLCSHAEGDQTTASGNFSHSEGEQTKAIGAYSHAEGCRTEANGRASHAEGRETTAFGDYSHTSGYYTKALHDNEAAYGKYNVSNDNTLFSIGDGTADDARHNAFEITTTGGKLHDKDIATTDLIPTELPANGGNADTVDGKSASDFVLALTEAQTVNTRILIPNNVDVVDWLVQNAKIGTLYYRTNYSSGQSNLPLETNDWAWFTFDGNRYFARVMASDYSTRDLLLDKVNLIGGWKEISTTPIKKISFSNVGTNAGGGGSLFSADFGTPITIACTSRADTQCTPFFAGNQWYVLAKDATTLDPVPQGSYSFDVWYI